MTPDCDAIAALIDWAEASHIAGDGQWNQRDFATPSECGTAYCIAGKWALDHGWRYEPASDLRPTSTWFDPEGVEQGTPSNHAREALGLTYDQAWGDEDDRWAKRGLFHESSTIDDLRRIAKDLRSEATS